MKALLLRKILLISVMLGSISAKAQYEWWPIRPGQVNYYVLDTGYYRFPDKFVFGIHITDSVAIPNGRRYNFNDYFHFNINSQSDCMFHRYNSPLGQYIDISDNGFTLYSERKTPLTFDLRANTGDSTIVVTKSHNFTIKLISQREVELFGELDSVKIYSISKNTLKPYYDSIILSKHYGLIRVPSIRTFDEFDFYRLSYDLLYDWDIPGTLRLVGNTAHPNNPYTPLTYKDCFDFKVGDVHHITEERFTREYSPSGISKIGDKITKSIIINTVLNRADYADSIVYQIKEEVYTSFEHKTYYSYSFTDSLKQDTLTIRISLAPHYMDTIISGTFTPIFDPWGPRSGQLLYVAKLMSFGLPGIVDVSLAHLSEEADSCLYEKSDWSKRGDKLYLKNLGGPYYSESSIDWFMGNWSSDFVRKLIYYNNSQGTWGMPYPFPLSVKEQDGNTKHKVNHFPNPANERFTIESNEVQSITITDVTGKIVYEKHQAEPTTTVTCKEWPAGIYFVKCSSANYSEIEKIVVQQ
jgi:hypothetical protein